MLLDSQELQVFSQIDRHFSDRYTIQTSPEDRASRIFREGENEMLVQYQALDNVGALAWEEIHLPLWIYKQGKIQPQWPISTSSDVIILHISGLKQSSAAIRSFNESRTGRSIDIGDKKHCCFWIKGEMLRECIGTWSAEIGVTKINRGSHSHFIRLEVPLTQILHIHDFSFTLEAQS